MKIKPVIFIVIIILSALLSGCVAVRPWEREYLGDPIMQPDGSREDDSVQQHFLGTIEGSAGAFGASGGGCGCN